MSIIFLQLVVNLFDAQENFYYQSLTCVMHRKIHQLKYKFIFEREFQLMTATFDESSLLSDQDTNRFLVYVGIEPLNFSFNH